MSNKTLVISNDELTADEWSKYSVKDKLNIINSGSRTALKLDYLQDVYDNLHSIIKNTSGNDAIPIGILDILLSEETEMSFVGPRDSSGDVACLTSTTNDYTIVDMQIDVTIETEQYNNFSESVNVVFQLYAIEGPLNTINYALISNSIIKLLPTKDNKHSGGNILYALDSVGLVILNQHIYVDKTVVQPSETTMPEALHRSVITEVDEAGKSKDGGVSVKLRVLGDQTDTTDIDRAIPYEKVLIHDNNNEVLSYYVEYVNKAMSAKHSSNEVDTNVTTLKELCDSPIKLYKFVATEISRRYKIGDIMCIGTESSKLVIDGELDYTIPGFMLLINSEFIMDKNGYYEITGGATQAIVLTNSIVINSATSDLFLKVTNSNLYNVSMTDISKIEDCTIRYSILNLINISYPMRLTCCSIAWSIVESIFVQDNGICYDLIGVTLYNYNRLFEVKLHGVPDYKIKSNDTVLINRISSQYENALNESMMVKFDCGYLLLLSKDDFKMNTLRKYLVKLVTNVGL